MNTTLYYIHDPMCSWCWGYRPVWDALQKNLPDTIQVVYVAGGLAPDSNTPMPIEQQAMIKAHWQTIEEKLGTEFNFDFWHKNTPRRSTYNACRAAIAAHNQGCQRQMINAIQRAYYLRALNPSDSEVLVNLASELSSQANTAISATEILAFDLTRFIADLSSATTQQKLMQQIELARELTNQGFPSLVLEHGGIRRQVQLNYKNYQATLTELNNIMTS
jgi:putative protein-disulfide isomerase